MGIHHNMTLSSLRAFAKTGILQKPKEAKSIEGQVRAMSIKVGSVRNAVKSLSGGNQQKVVLAKWMLTNPKIIIFDEPTRGIDVGAKAEIYKLMCDFVANGYSIIMISSEMPEAMGMSDRIIVLSNHRMSGEIARGEFSQESIVQLQFKHM